MLRDRKVLPLLLPFLLASSSLTIPGAAPPPTTAERPAVSGEAAAETAHFIDPTARIGDRAKTRIGERTYIGPFARLRAIGGTITVGSASNLQDNVTMEARRGDVTIGDHVIVAHGASISGPARIGAPDGAPAFISFNAVVEGATVEGDAIVSTLARIAPGVTIRAGKKVLPGKYVRTQAEADDPALGKVTAVADADRNLMQGILHVNENLARSYAALAEESPDAVRGINYDPGKSDFNPERDLPVLGGKSTAAPRFRNRIIGKVRMANTVVQLERVMGNSDAIRADEGDPFVIGRIVRMDDQVTFHALEHTGIEAGHDNRYGIHAVVHGGPDDGNSPPETTRLGNKVTVGDWAVVFRSTVGDGSRIGNKALVDGSQLAPGTVVPDRTIIINNERVGTVEW